MKQTLGQNLPRIATGEIVEIDGRAALLRLIESEGGSLETVTTAQLEALAERLSSAAGGGKTEGRSWTRSYLHQVLRGKLAPSARLAHAAAALLAEREGVPQLLTRSHPVMVQAVGSVQPGSVILSDSRPCAWPPCPVHFVPRSGNQRCCCPEHSAANRKRRHA